MARAQASIEFLIVTAIVLGYISFSLGIYAELEKALKEASLRKFGREVAEYIELCTSFPEGSEVKFEVKVPPFQEVEVFCNSSGFIAKSGEKVFIYPANASCGYCRPESLLKGTAKSRKNACLVNWNGNC